MVAAAKACFSAQVRVTGYVRARREAIVSLEMDGYRVEDVMARPGDQVSSGQALARLVRLPGAGPAGAAPAGGAAGRAGGQAQAHASAASGQGAGAGGQPSGPATITLQSPADGIVTRSSAVVGATASQKGDPLFMIAAGGDFEVEAEVPSIHIVKLQPGQPARVQTESGRDASGRVRRIFAEINPATQLGRIRIALDPGASLRIGTFVRGSIDAQRSCGVWLPRSAVLFGSSATTVQVVRNGAVETRRVRIGTLSGEEVEIVEGLSEGDLAIAFAGTSLRDGDKVTPVQSESGAR